MDIGSIFLILGLFILVAAFIARPLFDARQPQLQPELPQQDEHEFSALLAERDRVITTLQELDFDHTLGKIPEEEYPAQRAMLVQRGAEILRRLDTYQPAAQPVATAEDRLEDAIAARRQLRDRPVAKNGNGKVVVTADDDVEVLIASRRRVRPEKAGGFCPKCGSPMQRSDRFCPKCGGQI
jgi:hypothetical protein